jgi:hypothetical protein
MNIYQNVYIDLITLENTQDGVAVVLEQIAKEV